MTKGAHLPDAPEGVPLDAFHQPPEEETMSDFPPNEGVDTPDPNVAPDEPESDPEGEGQPAEESTED